MSGPMRYSPDASKSYSSVAAIAVGLAIVALILASAAIAMLAYQRDALASLETRLRAAEQDIAAVKVEQRELNETIAEATTAAEIARAVLSLTEESEAPR